MALDPITAGIDLVSSVVSRIWPDATDQVKAKAALAELAATGELKRMALSAGLAQGQIAVNATEAASHFLFVAGWRPWLGWVCGAAFAWAYVLQPILAAVLSASGSAVVLPTLDLSAMSPVLLGMLGLGGMRTVEKLKGAQGNH